MTTTKALRAAARMLSLFPRRPRALRAHRTTQAKDAGSRAYKRAAWAEGAPGQAGQGRRERGVLCTRATEDAGMRRARRGAPLRPRIFAAVASGALLCICLAAPSAQAAFGIEPGSLKATAINHDGSTDTQAGSHPYSYAVSFALNASGENVEGDLRDAVADLPPGFIGNPLALPRCPRSAFEGIEAHCPGDTQLGLIEATLPGLAVTLPVFNLVPPPGFPASLGTSAVSLNAIQNASLRTGAGYGVAVAANNIPTPGIRTVTETIWGTPSDPSHDSQRHCFANGALVIGCSSDAEPKPFLTLPTSCTGPLETTLKVDSAEEPGLFEAPGHEETALSLDAGANPVGLSGCDQLPFAPTIAVQPETTSLRQPHRPPRRPPPPPERKPEGLAEADLKNTVVTLPAGMAVNPSSADGLQGCTSAQFGLTSPPGATPITTTPGPAQCPDAAKIGSVEVDTPLLDHPLEGAVYLAAQGDNPFKSLLAIYVAVNDPQTGVVVKLAGQVEPNPLTGQLPTTFAENPQLPFEDFKLDFLSGPRAPLTTPPTCGEYTTETDLTPWTRPRRQRRHPVGLLHGNQPARAARACAPTPAAEPNYPAFDAGTVSPDCRLLLALRPQPQPRKRLPGPSRA